VSEQTVFLLSPAKLSGKRGQLLLDPGARFALAKALHSSEGAALGEVYSFVSSLYFRGKAAYVAQFASSVGSAGAWVITPGGGLCRLTERVTATRLAGWQRVLVGENNPHFTAPLVRHVSELVDSVDTETRFVLLGSVASKKYVVPLLEVLGSRLYYPAKFEGLGDMARGALLLRCAREGRELDYTQASPIARGVGRASIVRRPGF
jgi:hypothetical protein